MSVHRHATPRRYVSDAAFHLGLAARLLRDARKAGALGDAHLHRLENGARDLRRLVRELERGQA